MRVAIHQPNYLPWFGFFKKIVACDAFVLLDSVPFSKNNIQNRTRIKTAGGEVWLTIPVLTKGRLGQPTNEVRINNQDRWRKRHLKTIAQNYGRSPFYRDFSDIIETTLDRDWPLLADLTISLIREICRRLEIERIFYRASELDVSGTRTDLLVSICSALGAGTYLSGKGGMKYQDEALFREAGIDISYPSFEHPVYDQLYGPFLPGLSIIDMLFNCGVRAIEALEGPWS